MDFKDNQRQLQKQLQARQQLEQQQLQTRETLRTLQIQQQRLIRQGLQDSNRFKQLQTRERELLRELPKLEKTLDGVRKTIDDLAGQLHETLPQRAVENFDDRFPFLLFPVRLETRFKKVVAPETRQLQDELWLRIYPDDININTHEEILAEDEVLAAQTYWQQVWRAGGDKDRELGAWRLLFAKYGWQRAAWIVKTYRPNNEFDEEGHSNRPDRPLADDEQLDPEPTFDDYDAKQESWSQPPRAIGLPDRFVVQGFRAGKKVMERIGEPVPDVLIAGPNPSHPADENEGFKEDADELQVDAEMRWMVDFEEAIKVGMGMKIQLDDSNSQGFDRIVVLGLRLSADENAGQQLLENLIELHHYTEDGFSLIPQGTATNNTGSGGAGFKSFDPSDDESFAIELSEPLFNIESDWKQKRDGQYLAEYLGIDPAIFQHIQFSDGFDQRDARAMNTSLWPATMGYFLEEMMTPLFSDSTIKQTREFFIRYISGRGTIPAIRVRTQPYGILATSAFSRWRYPKNHIPDARTFEFEQELYQFLMRLDQDWDEMVKNASHAGKPGDSQQNLLDILGLHASSAEFHQRFAISLEQLSNMLKLKQLKISALDLASWLQAIWSGVLSDFGASPQERPEIFNKVFYKAQSALNGPLVDEVPLSDTTAVKPISQDDENYLLWLATSDIDTIRRQDFGEKDDQKIPAPRALLYLLLRHSVMNAYWDSAWNFYFTAELARLAPRLEPTFLYIRQENPGQSKFAALYRPAGELSEKHPDVFKDPNLTVAEQLTDDVIRLRPESFHLHEVREALHCLQDRPTNVLARAFSEHLDLCSYRLDAWKLGLVNQRLTDLRIQDNEVMRGLYLGAFGWLEDVRPKQQLQPFSGTAPDEFLSDELPPLQMAAENAGFIHGPSLNHAITAAVLRNAYITHAGSENGEVTAVNLTSERVRIALSIIEGTQNGQELGALLGYQFERGLHERYNQAEVDQFIFPLRKKFPLVGDQLNPSPDDAPIEAIEARNVINGVTLLRHIDESEQQRQYPFGLTGLPAATAAQALAINSEVVRLENIMDAVSDLMLSESVFQVLRGNYDRAGAVMNALSKAENLPDAEILETPRSGFAMTHRLCIQFETDIPSANRNPYSALPLTPRAGAEPGINKWLAGLLGSDPSLIVAIQVTEIREGEGPDGDDLEILYTLSLQDLQLQPIDLLFLPEKELQQQQSFLDQRIALAAKRKHNLAHDATLRIDYTQPVSGAYTLFELLPFLNSLSALIVDSRALNGEDMRLPSDDAQDLSADNSSDPNPQGWKVDDIKTRVQNTRQSLADLVAHLLTDKGALSPDASDSVFGNMLDHLMLAASLNLEQVIPEYGIEKTAAAVDSLKANVDAAIAQLTERIAQYDALLPILGDLATDDQVQQWMQAGNLLLGQDFTWTAAFQYKLPDEIENAFNDRDNILRHVQAAMPFPVDEWLYGLARVREKAKRLEQCILFTENFGKPAPQVTPLQLPYKTDDYWLALHYPEDYQFDGDRLLLSVIFAQSFDKTKPQAGLLVDEWTEVVPTRKETTGISFHYNAPNTEPPQTCLLAVTPEITGQWRWDDLIAILNETLDMAKKRAVEPQHIDDTKYAQFLPAVMVPATRYLITVATNLLANVGKADAIVDIPDINP